MKYFKKEIIIYSLFIILVLLGLSNVYATDDTQYNNVTVYNENELIDNINDMHSISDDEDALAEMNEEVSADEYVPDYNGIYVSPNGNNLIGNGSYSNPYKSIDKGISVASSSKTIYVAGGNYKISSSILISKDVTITSYDGNVPVIDGQNKCSLLRLMGNYAFTFNGITFMNGNATNGGVLDFKNYNKYSATFYNCTFVNNTATNNGGVFYVGRSDATYDMWDFLYLTSCSFYNNTANSGSIYWSDCLTYLTMKYCVASGNTNYAICSNNNRGCDLFQNYWGVKDTDNVIKNSAGDTRNSKLVIVVDNNVPNINDAIMFTAKIIFDDGSDFASNIYVPIIPVTFTTTSGVLSDNFKYIVNDASSTVLTPSEIGNVTVKAKVFDDEVAFTLNILPSPQYVSADAQDSEGDGSFNNPYSLKDAIKIVNNGGVNKIDLFQGEYEFNELYTLTRDVTICPYSTPYFTSKVSIKSNNGFLIISPNVNVYMYNLTIYDSQSSECPIFDIQSNSSLNISNFIIKDNILLNNGNAVIANVGQNAYLNIEYSQIINNIAITQNSQNGYLFNNNGTIIANNNWWGSNKGSEYVKYLSFGNEINATKYLILTQTQEKQILRTEWTSMFTIKLTDNDNNPIIKYLPDIDLIFIANTGNLDMNKSTLNKENSYYIINKIAEVTDDVVVEIRVNNETLKVIFEYEIPLTEIFISPTGDDEMGNGSLEKPFLTVGKAITRAKEMGSVFYFLSGTYDVNVVCKNSGLSLSDGGLTTIDNRNIIFSSYDGKVIFDRTNSYYVFEFGKNTNIVIDGIMFRNTNYMTGSKFGAIRSSGILTIKNCSFDNVSKGGNFAEFIGINNGKLYVYDSNFTNIGVSGIRYTNGAIHITGASAYAYIHNCLFANNGYYQTTKEGNIILDYGNSESAFRVQYATVDVVNCIFENSSKISMVYDHGKMSFKNCTFKDNGGGVACLHISSHAYGYNVTDCTFINNKAGAIGVSIDYLDDNEVNIFNSRFINNSATDGGAISLAKAGAIISNCYFEGNSAVNGGAIYNSYASLLIEHCEFYNNTATEKGGSIYTEGNDDYIDIQYNIFVNSKANVGGVIYNKGITSIFYNIMSNPTAEIGSYIYNDNRIGNVYLKIDNKTTYKDNQINITALLTDDMANPITGGNIVFYIDGEEIQTTPIEGIVCVEYSFNKTGSYVIDGNYTGSRRYVVTVGVGTINVIKKSIVIVSNNVTVYNSAVGRIDILLKDSEGNLVSNQNITLNIKGINYLLGCDENATIFKEFNLSIGTYPVILKFNENEEYYSSQYSLIFKVLPTINANDMTRGYNSGEDFNAGLIDANGMPLVNMNVLINVNGKTYNVKTNDMGLIKFNQKLAVGTYDIYITNPLTHEMSIKKLTIVKRVIGNKNLVMYYMDGSKLKVRIVDDNGKYVGVNQIVIFKINNVKYSVKTDKNGYACLSINAVPKTYTLTVEYKGFKTTNKLVVKQVLKASNVKVKKSAKVLKIKISLIKVNGKYLKGKKIILKFKGKKYNVKTNKKGVALFKINKKIIKKLKSGKKYSFTVSYLKTTIKKHVIVGK